MVRYRASCIGVEQRLRLTAATRPAALSPRSVNAAPRINIMAFRLDLSAPAACSIASAEAIAGVGFGKAGAERPTSSQAVSAGTINVAICPGYCSAARTARAPSAPTVRALAD